MTHVKYKHCKGKVKTQIGDQEVSVPCDNEITWKKEVNGEDVKYVARCEKCGQIDFIPA